MPPYRSNSFVLYRIPCAVLSSFSYWIGHTTNRGYTGLIGGVVTERYRAPVGFVPRPDTILTGPGVWREYRPEGKPDWLRAIRASAYGTIYPRPRSSRTGRS